MVQLNSPAICTIIKSKPHRPRRSLSATSLDVMGSVVKQKIWLFEGMANSKDDLSAERLSEEDTGKDDWCKNHCWFLYTNLVSVQQCAKCSKRIHTKRAAYKCTECKRLCHLKCAIKDGESIKSNTDSKISSAKSAMDFEKFVTQDEVQTCRYEWKTSNRGRKGRRKMPQVCNTNNFIEDMEIQEDPLHEEHRPSHQELDLSKLSELHSTASSHSQAKQKLHSMKHGFVKRCRSIKNKVKTLKNKVHTGDNHKSSLDQTLPSSSSTTSSSTQNTADQPSEQQKAWVRSPIRTRLREKQLEHRRESSRSKTRARRNNSARLRIFDNLQSLKHSESGNRYEGTEQDCPEDLEVIKDRIEVIERRVCQLETTIPQEINEWHQLKQRFLTNADVARRENILTEDTEDYFIDETHPKHIEATESAPLAHSASSGATSDDVYIVPDHPYSSSHDDNDAMIDSPIQGRTVGRLSRAGHQLHHDPYSPLTSLHDDSLPSGIPNKFRLNINDEKSHGNYSEHHTSTPVTNREISFQLASKKYETLRKVSHTNIAQINMDHSYSEPSHSSTSEIKLQLRTSIEMEPSVKVLSPEQVAVKSFLHKRKRNSIGGLSDDSRKMSESFSPSRIGNRSPYNLRSRSSNFYEASPKMGVSQASFYSSPPMASSTFHENGAYDGILSAGLSPLLMTSKYDKEGLKGDSEENVEPRYGTVDRNASSASNLSYTFRNDSQMIQTNAEEDLPGYIRNCSPNRRTREHHEEIHDILNEDNYAYLGTDRFAYETDGLHSKSSAHVTFATHDNMSTPITTTTDDALSLTNVTAFTGDLANSFADSGHGLTKSRWVNKDVRMFDRDEMDDQIRSRISLSHDKIDERGDGRKPPIPRKHYSSSSEIDYLKEAEKKLDMYKSRRSGERRDVRGSFDNIDHPTDYETSDPYLHDLEVREHILETESVPQSVTKLQMSPAYQSLKETEHDHGSPSRKEIPYNLRHGDLKTKSRSPSPRKGYDIRYTASREPSPSHSYSERSRSPSKGQTSFGSSKLINHGESDRLFGGSSQTHTNTTTEFEEIERRIKEESMQCRPRSQSLTNLKEQSRSSKMYYRQKSSSCTNSVDGETKAILKENARYHFLNDKGMIKISSPSLKIMNGSSPACRRKYESKCYHIDEENSDMVYSGSESNLSGVIVDNNFHFNGLSRNASDVDSRQTRSDFTQTGIDLETREMRDYQEQERGMLEEYLNTTDENLERWDNVLSWMNREHADEDVHDADVEHELEMLMEQEQAEKYEREIGTRENSHSPFNDTMYYSFVGQSEELREVLSPVRSSIHRSLSFQVEESFEIGNGLMCIILNGSIQDLENYLNSDRTISESEIKDALQWALDQRNFDITMLLLEDICKLIRGAEDEMCVDVFPAYLEHDRWQPIIVILTKQDFNGEWDLFMGLPVYRRRYDLVSEEAEIVVNSDFVKARPLSVDEFKIVRRVIRSAKLNERHRKLTVVNACTCRSRKGGQFLEDGLCIVIHCIIKGFIPFDEEPFPREIQGIPVDVREAYFLSGVTTPPVLSHRHKHQPEVLTNSESEAGSHMTFNSISSKCRSGSESNNMSRSSSIISLKNDVSNKSVMSYKPQVYGDQNTKEVNLNENDQELSDLKGGNCLPEDVIDKAVDSSGDTHSQSSQTPCLYIGSGITTVSVDGSSPGTVQGHGTVGGFIQLQDGGIGLITCAHIIGNCEENSKIKLQISDLFSDEKSIICGEIIKSVLEPGASDISEEEPALNDITGVDAALIRVTDRSFVQGKFIDIDNTQLQKAGLEDLKPPAFFGDNIVNLNDISLEGLRSDVIKIGAKTGLTTGRLYTDGSFVSNILPVLKSSENICNEFHNQFEVYSNDDAQKFFDYGDSGCLVAVCSDKTNLQCIGLAVGKTSYGSCVVTPIKAVLEKLYSI